jgi:hypothetical protein
MDEEETAKKKLPRASRVRPLLTSGKLIQAKSTHFLRRRNKKLPSSSYFALVRATTCFRFSRSNRANSRAQTAKGVLANQSISTRTSFPHKCLKSGQPYINFSAREYFVNVYGVAPPLNETYPPQVQ